MLTQETIAEPARDIPVFRRCDVLVVGGGPAGCAAAASAARMGADTILVERYGHLGGMSTGGLVLWIDRMTDWHGRQIIGGFADDLLERMPKDALMGPGRELWGTKDPGAVAYWGERHAAFHGVVAWSPSVDPEMLKIAYSDLLLERGVKLLLHSWAVAPIQDDNQLKGVTFESKAGRRAILARVVVDASGDGDIFALAGALFESDVEGDHIHASMNVAFRFGGVDFERYATFRREHKDDYSTIMARGSAGDAIDSSSDASGWATRPGRGSLPWRLPRNDLAYFMGPRMYGYSCIDVEDLTTVEIESRKRMVNLLKFYRDNMPGFENAWILDTAPQIGVRHSRRLVGVKKVTHEDWIAGKRQPDEIGLSSTRTPEHPPISVPLGCLIPATLDNLLAAGRDLSADAASHTLLREIPMCWMMGQAAGVAAAVAINSGVRVRHVDVREVQRQLRSQGARLSDDQSRLPMEAG